MRVLAALFLFVSVYAKHELYAGWKSYYVKPSNSDQLKTLGNLILELELDFISHPTVGKQGVVVVKPQYEDDFLNIVADENIEHWVHADDVKTQLDIDDQLIEAQRIATRSTNRERITYENYQPIEVIDEYLETIAQKYSEIVTLVSPAKSFEGHPIKYLKISKDNFQSGKPVIFIDAAIHAREWISTPTVTYAIHKLVENVTEPDLLDRFDWILFPVVNPDGYRYSFDVDRLWRKTRSTDQHPDSKTCPGVDGNRNFDFFWNTIGTSNNPCSNVFAGSKPFSEVEVRAVDDILHEHLDRLALYITMHSFGSMVLYSWGHNGTLSEHAFSLHTVGIAMADAIFELSLPHFPRYRVGNAALILNYASGAAEDYAHSLGIRLSYTYELPGFGVGLNGFLLDPIYIKQVAVETWAGLVVGARKAGEHFEGQYKDVFPSDLMYST